LPELYIKSVHIEAEHIWLSLNTTGFAEYVRPAIVRFADLFSLGSWLALILMISVAMVTRLSRSAPPLRSTGSVYRILPRDGFSRVKPVMLRTSTSDISVDTPVKELIDMTWTTNSALWTMLPRLL